MNFYMSDTSKAIKIVIGGGIAVLSWIGTMAYNQFSRDTKGYNKYGFDKDGFDRLGYNKYGRDKDGYNKQGYDNKGYDRTGYDKYGYDKYGFDREGFNKKGYNRNALDRNGLDVDGFDCDGYNAYGLNRANYTREGGYYLLMNQKERLSDAFHDYKRGRCGSALNECRRIMECVLLYICKIEKCLPSFISLAEMLNECGQSGGIFDSAFLNQLKEARRYCNNGSHYHEEEEAGNNVYFTLKTIEELLNLWDRNYIKR